MVDTPMAIPRIETKKTSGLMLIAAAPAFDDQQNLIGVLYGGVLINQNYEIVDRIKQTVFQGVEYEGKDIGTATIFLDDVRISTNVLNEDGLESHWDSYLQGSIQPGGDEQRTLDWAGICGQ